MPGHELEPELVAVVRDRRRARRRSLRAEHDRLAAGRPEQRGQVAARAVQVRLDDLEREAGRDRGVERVAALLEHGHTGRGGEPVRRGDHPEGAAQLGAGRERSSGCGDDIGRVRGEPRRRSTRRDEMAGDEVAGVRTRAAPDPPRSMRAPTARASGQRVGSGSRTAVPAGSARHRRARTRRRARCTPGSGTTAADSSAWVYGCCGFAKQIGARGELDDLAEIHDGDAVAEVLDRREVVRDEQAREAELVLQVAQQIEDRRLDRDVECRDRLVGDQHARLEDQRAREPDALSLSARQLVREAVAQLAAQTDRVEHLLDARVQRRALVREAVQPQRLADDVADSSCVG